MIFIYVITAKTADPTLKGNYCNCCYVFKVIPNTYRGYVVSMHHLHIYLSPSFSNVSKLKCARVEISQKITFFGLGILFDITIVCIFQVRNIAMITLPFILFWSIGVIFEIQLDYLVKLGLLVLVYVYSNVMNEFVFDERLFNVLPLSIYFANKLYFYVTWIYYVMPYLHSLTSVFFLSFSGLLWYNFLKAWKGDPGLIKTTEDQRFRAIIELAERSTDKNPFDMKVFCCT